MNRTIRLTIPVFALLGFLAGRLTVPSQRVNADTGSSPVIQVQTVRADTSLTVYYPDMKKLFVYQSPFVGSPKWGCAYTVQLSDPGGSIERQPCPDAGAKF